MDFTQEYKNEKRQILRFIMVEVANCFFVVYNETRGGMANDY